MRSEIAHPCSGPSASVLSTSRSNVPCGSSILCSAMLSPIASTGIPYKLSCRSARGKASPSVWTVRIGRRAILLYDTTQQHWILRQPEEGRMFFTSKPNRKSIEAFIAAQQNQDFSYVEVGCTRGKAPNGYTTDHNRIKLGQSI